eukprot:2687828-Amphidinium_carterae.2
MKSYRSDVNGLRHTVLQYTHAAMILFLNKSGRARGLSQYQFGARPIPFCLVQHTCGFREGTSQFYKFSYE